VHSRTGRPSESQYEDFSVIRRHLAGPKNPSPQRSDSASNVAGSPSKASGLRAAALAGAEPITDVPDLTDGFSSLKMQGGDITREIYRRTEAEERGRVQRSKSIGAIRSPGEREAETIRQPGGFRRNHIIRNTSPPRTPEGTEAPGVAARQPTFITRNFYEFLSVYGHFAGEDYESDDDEEVQFTDNWESHEDQDDYFGDAGARAAEERPLIRRATTARRQKEASFPKKGAGATILILLKSFVGTGVLFLPRAFLNGGMLFSFIVLALVAAVSYYCFLLLTTSRLALKVSYAEMGEIVHGKWMKFIINFSLVVSQIGFASAYIVFTSENLRAFILAVSKGKTAIDIKLMILMQLVIFLPLSLYRNLNNISIVVYIADIFIVLGLIYLYYYDIATLVVEGVSDIALVNKENWPLFIGTAIFTFEGIGLLIPIQDGMKKPQQLPVILGGVMVLITIIFISMGALSYAAYGSKTETVIILNMPQDNKFVNGVQFLYSLAILLSTPLQIFPAITIMEKGVFTKSGKYSKGIKWRKNGFRFLVVMLSALVAWIGANDLDKFVALVGSFACIPLVYIYPVSTFATRPAICTYTNIY
jgi:proton-coupled amino acid transporter